MKLRVRSSSGLTQLGGDRPPEIQSSDEGLRVQGSFSTLHSGHGAGRKLQSKRTSERLQPANAPMRGNLQQLQPKAARRPKHKYDVSERFPKRDMKQYLNREMKKPYKVTGQ